MTQLIVVNLSSNGDYWQADWKDLSGQRRKRSLGPKAEFSRRQAKKLCQKLENTLNKKPGMADAAKAPALDAFVEAYIASRTDLKSGTLYLHRLTKKYLNEFFGQEIRIDQITRAGAREWQTALSNGRFSTDRPMAAPTVRGHIVNAKAMFRRATEDDLILFNPFDRVTVPLPKMDKNWHYVSLDELDKLLDACKTENTHRAMPIGGTSPRRSSGSPLVGGGLEEPPAHRLRREDRQQTDRPNRAQALSNSV